MFKNPNFILAFIILISATIFLFVLCVAPSAPDNETDAILEKKIEADIQ